MIEWLKPQPDNTTPNPIVAELEAENARLRAKAKGHRAALRALNEAYLRLKAISRHYGPVNVGGCTCRPHIDAEGQRTFEISPSCAYHAFAKVRPWDHSIPWNCPTYYDGCNCRREFRELRAKIPRTP